MITSAAELALTRQPNLEAALAHFRALMQKDDSPIRAIRHQPARAAEYVDIPAAAHRQTRTHELPTGLPEIPRISAGMRTRFFCPVRVLARALRHHTIGA
jgi:hypothetical protein